MNAGPQYANVPGTINLTEVHTPCTRPDADAELWFSESTSRKLTLEQIEAKRLCGECPVRVKCAEYALTAREAFGIWGGLTPAERGVLSADRKSAHGAVARQRAS